MARARRRDAPAQALLEVVQGRRANAAALSHLGVPRGHVTAFYLFDVSDAIDLQAVGAAVGPPPRRGS